MKNQNISRQGRQVRQGKIFNLFLCGLCVLGASLFFGCSTTQQQQASSIIKAIEPLVASYAQTGQVDYAQAIPVALQSIAILDPKLNIDPATLSGQITGAVSAFTNNTGGSTGQKIASTVLAFLPPNPTGAQANAALVQASVGASNGANQ